jgi:hypothetical protein
MHKVKVSGSVRWMHDKSFIFKNIYKWSLKVKLFFKIEEFQTS